MERTDISRNNIDFLTQEERSAEQMVKFLKEGAMFRRFDQILREVYPEDDLASRLENGLAEISGEDPAAVGRKVRNWLKGSNVPKNRETLFQICFVLGLSEADASKVLGNASETGIHYRNPEELVYAYGLRAGISYPEAAALKEKMRKLYERPEEKEEIKEEGQDHYTFQMRDAFSQVSGEEELADFFREHACGLGRLHETAYLKFSELLDRLLKPESFCEVEEQKYTMEKVMDTYIRMHVPETKRTADYTLLQRMIKKYWPSESSLLNMKNRREDVSRKVMILLYLITEAFDEERGDGNEEDEWLDVELEEDDPDTVMETRWRKMDLFLNLYGMNRLDAGNPFDYLAIYAMRANRTGEVSGRMEAVLDSLFDMENE